MTINNSVNFHGATLTSRRLPNENSRTNAARNNSAFGVVGNDMSAQMLNRRQGDTTLNEGSLQLSLHGSFMSFMETGKVANSDNMEDYSMFDDRMQTTLTDTARRMFFSAYQGDGNYNVRSLEEMARLFDERIEALRNATGISEQRREICYSKGFQA